MPKPNRRPKKSPHRKPRPKSNPANPQRIMEMVWAFAPPLITEAALHNGVFDAIDAGAKTIDQIAHRTSASPRGISILLDGLVAIGLVHRRRDKFSLSPDAAAFLIHTKPAFLGGLLKHASRQLIASWLGLSECVRAGRPSRPVNQQDIGGEFFAQFVEDLLPMGFPAATAVAAALIKNPDRPISVLDIAAGSGVWGIAMATGRPGVHVTAVDWPQVIPVTRRVAQRHHVADQFTFVEGDILQADLGSGHHVATLGHILHSEGETRSRRLLQRVHAAMSPGGTIVIAEFLPDQTRLGPPVPLIFAVNMLVNTEEGNTYSFKQISSWLKEAGFHRPRLFQVPGPSPLILATA